MKPRSVHRSVSLEPRDRGGGFVVAQPIQILGVDADPFLLVDWAKMAHDPFGPHPHAGFSAVTWLLPQSAGSIRNRDSLGDDSVFHPGELHWFEAAHGAVHNESPVTRRLGGAEPLECRPSSNGPSEPRRVPGPSGGAVAELLQIFVNLPAARKHDPARTYRATVRDIPVVPVGDSRVRVVVGAFEGRTSPVVPRTPEVAILDVDVDGAVNLPVPRGHNALVIGTAGQVAINGSEDNVVFLNDDGDGVTLVGRGHVVLLHGRPLREPVMAAGPFVMSTRADLVDAIQRYNRGEMGEVLALEELA